jgi:hypothetical protein
MKQRRPCGGSWSQSRIISSWLAATRLTSRHLASVTSVTEGPTRPRRAAAGAGAREAAITDESRSLGRERRWSTRSRLPRPASHPSPSAAFAPRTQSGPLTTSSLTQGSIGFPPTL